jgi:DNA gyrase/topoisomerase IV subunit A
VPDAKLEVADGDECKGLTVVGDKDKYVVIVTDKGIMKKCESEFLGSAGKRKSASSYLTSLDNNDNVYMVETVTEDQETLTVVTRTDIIKFELDNIPTLTRRAKGQKLIPLPVGSNIITIKAE